MRHGAAWWLPLVALAVLAGLTLWLERVFQPPQVPRDSVTRNDPDYIVTGLSAVKMDAGGQVRHVLTAQKMTHFPRDDSTELLAPKFVSHEDRGVPVTITALRAWVSADGEQIQFRDTVRVVRAAHGNRGELVMETEYLEVDPDRHIARTDQAVRIRDTHTVVDAIGLELNSDTRVLTLLSRVRGTYHDPKSSAVRN